MVELSCPQSREPRSCSVFHALDECSFVLRYIKSLLETCNLSFTACFAILQGLWPGNTPYRELDVIHKDCTEPCSDGVFIWCQLSNRFVQRDAASATSISTLANVPERSVATTSNRLRMLPPATPDLACFQALRVAHPEGVQLHLHSSRGGRPLPSEQR